jgi:hypothetical protein
VEGVAKEGGRSVKLHLHISLVHAFLTVLEFLIAWIPIKLVAANYEGRSALASGVLHVL